ncbi:MAG: aminoacyl-tRNA hydrolase [Saprospirales bacterium]|nr:aminoacyl-tRNA hydrolase [Saprospirales bacterium]MBK8923082.1 aminoacyl-tRNA hydrolase [Saprospirales bacterium]
METAILLEEFTYRTSRSGGKGGQNVNKVETKVEACLDVAASEALTPPEKALIFENLAHRISASGILAASCQTERSQLANKEKASAKLLALVQKALIRPKKRKRTRIPPEVKAARLEAKKRQSEKKAARRIDPR